MAARKKFEGQDVVDVRCRVGGEIGDGRLNDTLTPGTRVVVVGEAVVGRITHSESDIGLVRLQVLKLAEGFIVADAADADDLIHKLRADRRKALDELLGTPPLDGMEEA